MLATIEELNIEIIQGSKNKFTVLPNQSRPGNFPPKMISVYERVICTPHVL